MDGQATTYRLVWNIEFLENHDYFGRVRGVVCGTCQLHGVRVRWKVFGWLTVTVQNDGLGGGHFDLGDDSGLL